jgi:hypothetical protein
MREIQQNTGLLPGDRISVSSSSRVIVIWPHYGQSVLQAGTVLNLRDVRQSDDHETFVARLSLEAGWIWTRLQKVLGPSSVFEVRVSNVVATVRGTSFGVRIAEGKAHVQVLEHAVSVYRVIASDAQEVGGERMVEQPVTIREGFQISIPVADELEEKLPTLSPLPTVELMTPDTKPTEEFLQGIEEPLPEELLQITQLIEDFPPEKEPEPRVDLGSEGGVEPPVNWVELPTEETPPIEVPLENVPTNDPYPPEEPPQQPVSDPKI